MNKPTPEQQTRILNALAKCYEDYAGKAWEPKDPQAGAIRWAVAEGFLRRLDGRCMFEAFKDSHVGWTLAGEMAIKAVIDSRPKEVEAA